MRRFYILWVLLGVVSLLLSACGPVGGDSAQAVEA